MFGSKTQPSNIYRSQNVGADWRFEQLSDLVKLSTKVLL